MYDPTELRYFIARLFEQPSPWAAFEERQHRVRIASAAADARRRVKGAPPHPGRWPGDLRSGDIPPDLAVLRARPGDRCRAETIDGRRCWHLAVAGAERCGIHVERGRSGRDGRLCEGRDGGVACWLPAGPASPFCERHGAR